jgi:hypothetical protein
MRVAVVLRHLFDFNPNRIISGVTVDIFDFCAIEIIVVALVVI